MIVGILQPGYLPWLGFFEQVHRADVFVLYDDVQFDKGGWRNRNRIKTPAGPQWLTVPVSLKGGDPLLIKDVAIAAARSWQKKHVHAIRQNYARAPFFERCAEPLCRAIEKPWRFLLDLDLELIGLMLAGLGIATPTRLASDLGVGGSGTQRLVDIVRALGGTEFYEGAAGRQYIDPARFQDAGIALTYQEYVHPEYPQLHGPFVPYLSALDLLANCGPDSLRILTHGRSERNALCRPSS